MKFSAAIIPVFKFEWYARSCDTSAQKTFIIINVVLLNIFVETVKRDEQCLKEKHLFGI